MSKKNYANMVVECSKVSKNCIGFKTDNSKLLTGSRLCLYNMVGYCYSEICKINLCVLTLKELGIEVKNEKS